MVVAAVVLAGRHPVLAFVLGGGGNHGDNTRFSCVALLYLAWSFRSSGCDARSASARRQFGSGWQTRSTWSRSASKPGLGLDAALRQMATKLKGPLSEEIALALRQIGMGRPRREALEDMAERVDVLELTTFVNAVIQAEQLGTSLGRVLRAQAVSLRVRRRQRAEETARKAPVKMVFPLVLFIMPSFFVITLGPMIVHLSNYLNG